MTHDLAAVVACRVTNGLRQRATGTGYVGHHRAHHARRQVAHREAELPTPLTLLVLNTDVTEQATEDAIGRHVRCIRVQKSGYRSRQR
jgi:hypothetical protein